MFDGRSPYTGCYILTTSPISERIADHISKVLVSDSPHSPQVDGPIAHWRSSDKHPHHLRDHLKDVGALSAAFASKLKLDEAGELIGLLHDLGKYSKEFQDYIRSALGLKNPDEDDYVDVAARRGKVDHSSAGAQFVWRALSAKGPTERVIGQFLALCIASHHSGLIDCLDPDGEDTFGRRMMKGQEKTHLDEASGAADAGILARCDEILENPGLIQGLKVLIDRIVKANPPITDQRSVGPVLQIGLALRFLFSCLIDADRIDTADFERNLKSQDRPSGDYVEWAVLIDRLERHLSDWRPSRPIDAIRRNISQHCLNAASRPVGVYTLTVPTGGGKTLASLRFALHHAQQRQISPQAAPVSKRQGLDRIIYVVPFNSIIDQNAREVRAILEPVDAPADQGRVVLEHHSSLTPEQQSWREKILSENWDAPVVYTTMVQLLESLFGAGTRGARRMHQLANAVVVFDEVQALPIKCVHLFNNAVNFLVEQCNSTVVLCTATQPLLDRVAPEKGAIRLAPEHELMPDTKALFETLKRVEVRDRRKPRGWSDGEVAELALDETRRTGSCLVIVNTKRAARAVYKICSQRLKKEEVSHLSTDMCPTHRKNTLGSKRDPSANTVIGRLERGVPILCVSTQLIEAGIDVDFGAVVRFSAGLDSIAQAAGRCNRNGNPAPGTVHVVNPTDENLRRLPDIAVGRDKAQRVMDDFREDPARYADTLFGPEALAEYYRYYFFDQQGEMEYPVPASEIGHDDTLLNLLSYNDAATSAAQRQHDQVPPGRLLHQAFMAAGRAFKAIDAPTRGVIVPYERGGAELIADLERSPDAKAEFGLLRRAQQYTVNVFPHILRQLGAAKAVRELPDTRILCLDKRYYSSMFGLATETVSPMEMLYV